MARDRKQAERRGHSAEIAALVFLRLKGYRLLAQRYKSSHGEIDLIMRRGKVTAFVEVKLRATHEDAIAAVSPYQSKRIAAAASLWMMKDQIAAQGHCRFDIVAVNSYLWPTHIENAFEGTP
jgi:putative endonuclease